MYKRQPIAINNKVSLEDLFILIKTQNNQFQVLREQIDEKFDEKFNQMNIKFNVKFDSFDIKLNELKKQSNLRNVKLNQLDEKFEELKNEMHKRNFDVDKRINEIELENKRGVDLSLIHI